ncbi:putative NTPase (NACHT family) [Burkholderia sp. 8Y]|uniref:NACHT domain-containing protein n=1 Tax=Burkholderia sp. 8Y TaxID=2653133 RepID=UPI0012F0ECEC|nr:hypothetical protein [Burkholderia sp. 8Y]VXB60553.1 putative NTPase (NACHT family) [Burkholderia sp. 8Y]
MDNLNWKLEKVKSLDDEVKQLHPLLLALFNAMTQLKHVYYTQGNREAGADFVLVRSDDLLGQDDYVGVIVKSKPIRQDHDDVNRQIKECTLAPRPIENGKKNVFLSEVWVVTSKDITRNAQDFLHLEYKTTKIKFIDGATLTRLIDKHFPSYWDHLDASLGKYINDQKALVESLEVALRLLPPQAERLQIDHYIQRLPERAKLNFLAKTSKPVTLLDELKRRRFVFIEGGMGAGKSELLRSTVLKLCEKEQINQHRMVPYFTSYRDLVANKEYKSGELLTSLRALIGDDAKSIAIFVDGFDEIQGPIQDKVDDICRFANSLNERDDVRLIVSSRDIGEAILGETISKSFDKYIMCPLTYGAVVSVVQSICDNGGVSAKLRDDLHRSPLMRALPRTPLSAILLGTLLKENINELPSTLPELYSKYVELVLGRWDIKKGNGSEKEYETIQRLTAMIATHMLDHDLTSMSLAEVKAMFQTYLDERKTGQSLGRMLEGFTSRSELVSFNSETEQIMFRHRTFAEYFYAHALLMLKGKDAPVENPFAPERHGIEYFYLGLVRDSPERIKQLSSWVPRDMAEEFIKLCNFGSFLMAAYQTPYSVLEEALYKSFKDVAVHYVGVVRGEKRDWLSNLPELQLLSFFTFLVKRSYSYEFFKPALLEAKLQVELDCGLDEEQSVVLIFLLDAVLASLNDANAFKSLVDRHDANLSWAIRLGIKYSAQEVSFINSATTYMERKIKKSLKGNIGMSHYIEQLESTPLLERKDLAGWRDDEGSAK